MADTVKPIMPAGLPSDLQGIYRLMGYQDDYNYDDEKYATQYAAALELLRTAIGGGEGGAALPTVSASDNGKVLKVKGTLSVSPTSNIFILFDFLGNNEFIFFLINDIWTWEKRS